MKREPVENPDSALYNRLLSQQQEKALAAATAAAAAHAAQEAGSRPLGWQSPLRYHKTRGDGGGRQTPQGREHHTF